MTGRKGIRRRLSTVFVFLTIGPLMLVGMLLSWQIYDIQKEEAIQLQREITKRVVNELLLVSEELISDIEGFVSITDLLHKSRDEQRMILDSIEALSFRQNKNVFSEMSLLDMNGQEQAKVSMTEFFIPSDLRNRKNDGIFIIPAKEKDSYFGPAKKDSLSHESIMEMSIPLIDNLTGNVEAVLVMTVRLNQLWDSVIEEGISGKVSIFITSEKGGVVSHDDPSISLAEKKITVPVAGEIITGFDGFKSVRLSELFQLGTQKFHEENHICRIIVRGDLGKIKTLVMDPKFVCKNCGRASHSSENICKPTKL